ncbi:MAG TPA: hypothetical protein GX735_04290 [Firmicutes bacterium]|nr:hypothetical protein [Bacillota bacterium]
MAKLKIIGFLAFVATGLGLIITSAVRQTSPWFLILAVIGVGYLFGLIKHSHSLRS